MAVFQARAATRPRAVVMRVENLSRTSAVNALSFRSFGPAVGVVVGHGAVFRVGLQEVFHGVCAPAHDHLLSVSGEAGADVGLAADAAAAGLPGGAAGGASAHSAPRPRIPGCPAPEKRVRRWASRRTLRRTYSQEVSPGRRSRRSGERTRAVSRSLTPNPHTPRPPHPAA